MKTSEGLRYNIIFAQTRFNLLTIVLASCPSWRASVCLSATLGNVALSSNVWRVKALGRTGIYMVHLPHSGTGNVSRLSGQDTPRENISLLRLLTLRHIVWARFCLVSHREARNRVHRLYISITQIVSLFYTSCVMLLYLLWSSIPTLEKTTSEEPSILMVHTRA